MKRKDKNQEKNYAPRRLIADREARGCVMGVGAKRVSERKEKEKERK